MFEKFYPDKKFSSISEITPEFFAENGIEFAILDIDNTLVAYTKPVADENARAFLEMLKDCGIAYALVSNNHKARVEKFASEFGAFFVHDSGKPFLFGIKRAMRKMGAKKENTILIGEQVFTNVKAGKRAGILTVMVDPIEAKETPFFGLKRKLERIVLKDYGKDK